MCNFHHCTSDALGPSRRPKKQDLDVPNHVSPLWQTSPLFMHHHHAYGRDKNHLRKRVLDLPNHVSVLWYLRSWVTTILTGITRVTSLRVLLWNGTYLKIVLLWYYPEHWISCLFHVVPTDGTLTPKDISKLIPHVGIFRQEGNMTPGLTPLVCRRGPRVMQGPRRDLGLTLDSAPPHTYQPPNTSYTGMLSLKQLSRQWLHKNQQNLSLFVYLLCIGKWRRMVCKFGEFPIIIKINTIVVITIIPMTITTSETWFCNMRLNEI